jgi:hypothetical protein
MKLFLALVKPENKDKNLRLLKATFAETPGGEILAACAVPGRLVRLEESGELVNGVFLSGFLGELFDIVFDREGVFWLGGRQGLLTL